jgi:hypothetical protein
MYTEGRSSSVEKRMICIGVWRESAAATDTAVPIASDRDDFGKELRV